MLIIFTDAQEESLQIFGTGRIVRPTNALDPLGSPLAKNPAFSSLMRPDDTSTPERPRFSNFNQILNRNTPLSELRMPSPYPSSPDSNQSTTPTSTPPRPPPGSGIAVWPGEPTTPTASPSRSVLAGLLGGLDLEPTTPTNTLFSRLHTFLDSSGDSQSQSPEPTTPIKPRLSSSDSGVHPGASRPIATPPRSRLPSISSNPRGIHPLPPLSTLGVSRTSAQLRKRGRSGDNEEIERIVKNEDQLDGPSEPMSPTMTATRPTSGFGGFERGFRDIGRALIPSTLSATAAVFYPSSTQTTTARRSNLDEEFKRIINAGGSTFSLPSQDETSSPGPIPNAPPNSPNDAPQPLQNLVFRKSRFIPAGESHPIPPLNLTPAVAQRGESSQPVTPPPNNEPRTPTERPSFRESMFFQLLDTTQQAHVVDASACGFYNLSEREVRLVGRQSVAIRDFAFEALMRGQNEEVEAEMSADDGESASESQNEADTVEASNAGGDVNPEVESSTAPATENNGQADAELTREQSFRNIYGSFGYKHMMDKKKREEESSSSEDEWAGLVLNGRMGYGS